MPVHRTSRSAPAPSASGPVALMAITRSGVHPRLLAAMAARRAETAPAHAGLDEGIRAA